MATHETFTSNQALATLLGPPIRGGSPITGAATWQGSVSIWSGVVIGFSNGGSGNAVVEVPISDIPGVTAVQAEVFGVRTFNTAGEWTGVNVTKVEWSLPGSAVVLARWTYDQPTFFGIDLVLALGGIISFLDPIADGGLTPIQLWDSLFAGADTLAGADAGDSLRGGLANDRIIGGGGADSLIGDEGDDTFVYRAGDAATGEQVVGGIGTDRVLADGVAATRNLLQAGAVDITALTINTLEEVWTNGAEVVVRVPQFVPGGFTTIVGKAGATDVITFRDATNADFSSLSLLQWDAAEDLVGIIGSAGNDTAIGTAFADVFVGLNGADSARGLAGDDRFIVGPGDQAGADTLDGGIGTDVLQVDAGANGTHDLRNAGLNAIETLDAVGGTIQLSARKINGGVIAGASTFISDQIGSIVGNSTDSLSRPVGLEIHLDSGMTGITLANLTFTNWNDGFFNDKTVKVFGVAQTQAVIGAPSEENWILLQNAAQNTVIVGGGQLDVLVGGNFNDVIDGSGGDDTIVALNGNDSVGGGAGTDTLVGGLGNDFLNSGIEADDLFGEAGNDSLVGGAGADSIDGGGDFDLVSFLAEGGNQGVFVDLGSGNVRDSHGTFDRAVLNVEGFQGTNLAFAGGGTLSDILIGDGNGNYFFGAGGQDYLIGAGGDDYLDLGAGAAGVYNIAEGQAGADTVLGGADADFAYGGDGSDSLAGGGGGDYLIGGAFSGSGFAGIDSAAGGDGDDVLAIGSAGGRFGLADGGAGNDFIYGGDGVAGDDVLRGGAGSDYMWMGSGGTDAFRFEAADLVNGDVDTLIVSFAGTWQFSFAAALSGQIAVIAGVNAGTNGVYLSTTGGTWLAWVPYLDATQAQAGLVFA